MSIIHEINFEEKKYFRKAKEQLNTDDIYLRNIFRKYSNKTLLFP